MAKYEHTVTTEESGLTINQILRANYRFSARFRTKMKYQSLVDLNGVQTPGYIRPSAGDVIGVRLPEETSDFEPEDIPLDIVYEDANQRVVVTVTARLNPDRGSLSGAFSAYLGDASILDNMTVVYRMHSENDLTT